MPVKTLIYDIDPVWHAIKELQNRCDVLEGKTPRHEVFCRACKGTGKVQTLMSGKDDLEITCRFCNGEGK